MDILNPSDVYEARGFAESLMWERCLVKHHIGDSMDPDSGLITPDYAIVYGAPDGGPCRFKAVRAAIDRDVWEQGITILRAVLHLPVDSAGIEVEDKAWPNWRGPHARSFRREHDAI